MFFFSCVQVQKNKDGIPRAFGWRSRGVQCGWQSVPGIKRERQSVPGISREQQHRVRSEVSVTRTRKFGRVVKALALGASLERGVGSNPTACTFCAVVPRVLGWLSR